ncbi:PREDICTED: testis-specific protein TEX28 [Hipposideros armiger]|uniref:Testis-specific protein TEX28 n=1 Tax=Hipposideros armiger TaxID=186990 RepID=A0A8B7T3Z6_HIPAR|nr:PREDICTED: testis-specific protein TEX28 [Hipposideros armiger]
MVLKAEYTKSPSATLPSSMPLSRSVSSSEDGPSSHSSLSDRELVRNLQDNIKHRILHLSEQLRVEKNNRDENTMGYIKLVSKADQLQAPHIRQAFEKVNQRASATIARIERRLHQCHQQLQDLEKGCWPKEHSPDHGQQPSENTPLSEPPKPGEEDCLSTNLSDIIRYFPLESDFPAFHQGKSSETKRVAQQQNLLLQKVKEELKEVEKLHLSLQVSYQSLKERYLTDLQVLLESLQEEKCRHVLLEELVNVYLQEHLNEIYHLKQNLACAEEKMVYLSYERAKEMWEVMEIFKSRISKLETLQQMTQLEMTESRPWFIFRFVALLLTLATLLLVFTCTVCASPLLLVNSHLHVCTMLVLIGLGALAWQKWHAILALHWQAWVPSR